MSRMEPCHICKGAIFTWGEVNNTDQFSESPWVLGRRSFTVHARRCETCGNVQFFTPTQALSQSTRDNGDERNREAT